MFKFISSLRYLAAQLKYAQDSLNGDELEQLDFVLSDYSHIIFGEFGQPGKPESTGGMVIRESIGPDIEWLKHVMDYSVSKMYTDFIDAKGPEFEAVLVAGTLKDKVLYTLIFNDRQTDQRYGVYSAYMLAVPKEDKEIQKEIKQDPSKVIELFREVFPKYDRSKGQLKIIQTKFL